MTRGRARVGAGNARSAPRLQAVLALVLCVALAGCRDRGEQAAGTVEQPAERAAETVTVTLQFPGEDGMLHAEQRQLALPAGDGPRLSALVTAVLGGPTQPGLLAPFPPGIEVASAYLDPQGLAYVDLASKELPDPPASGSAVEMVRVYSVVNTVLANEERARGVVLLWNGRQRQTFAGHVDTQRPLRANRQLVR
jgi:hypothetical protein